MIAQGFVLIGLHSPDRRFVSQQLPSTLITTRGLDFRRLVSQRE